MEFSSNNFYFPSDDEFFSWFDVSNPKTYYFNSDYVPSGYRVNIQAQFALSLTERINIYINNGLAYGCGDRIK